MIEANNPEFFEFGKGLMADVKETDENILDVFIGTESGIYYTCPEDKQNTVSDYKTRDWYVDALAKPDEVIFTKPYTSTTTGKRMISIAKSIKKDSEIIGVVGMK